MTRTVRTTPNVKIARMRGALRDEEAAEVVRLHFTNMRAIAALARAEIGE